MDESTFKAIVRKFVPRAILPYRICAGPLAGRTIVTSLHDYPGAIFGWTEKPLLKWLLQNVNPGETWLDIGAHYGYTAIALAELVGKSGRVYAFEPSLTTAGHLNRTRRLNALDQITVVPLGLSDSAELRILSIPMNRGMADHSLASQGTDSIYVASCDWIRPSLCPQPIHGVKIDVQGMEFQVLSGMKRTLIEDRPKVIIEFHTSANRQSIIELLRQCGYHSPGIAVDSDRVFDGEDYGDDRSYYFECRNG